MSAHSVTSSLHSKTHSSRSGVTKETLLDEIANSLDQGLLESTFEDLLQQLTVKTSRTESRRDKFTPSHFDDTLDKKKSRNNTKTDTLDKTTGVESGRESSNARTGVKKLYQRENESGTFVERGSCSHDIESTLEQNQGLKASNLSQEMVPVFSVFREVPVLGSELSLNLYAPGETSLSSSSPNNNTQSILQSEANKLEMPSEAIIDLKILNTPIDYRQPEVMTTVASQESGIHKASMADALTENHQGYEASLAETQAGTINLPTSTTNISEQSTVQTVTPLTVAQQQNQLNKNTNNDSMLGIANIGKASTGNAGVKTLSPGSVAVSQTEKIMAIQELKKQIKTSLQRGETHMIVHLKPDNLGAVDIRIDITRDGKAAVFFKAEQHDTMELLTRYAYEFQQVFQESGLNADMSSMNFGSSQQDFKEAPSELAKPHETTSSEVEIPAMSIAATTNKATGLDIQV